MGIFSLLEHRYKIISIVGMAKNAGKTVTLNHLIESAYAKNISFGLTSIGRDGERQDIVTKTDKPMIFVPEGTWIATAEMLFHLSEARMEVIEVTSFETAMGKVVIGRTRSEGFVQIGGPSSNHAVRMVSEKMLALGSSYVFVDGALDRTSSASPSITDACILSTGAVLSRDMAKAVSKTAHKVSLFSLPDTLTDTVKDAFDHLEHTGPIALVDVEGAVTPLDSVVTALGAGRAIAAAISEKTAYCLISGALVYSTLLDVIQTTPHFKNVTFVVGDATRLFIDEKDWLYLKRVGVTIHVRYKMALLAITVNPYAPAGYFYDSQAFIDQLSQRVEPIPVYNVFEGTI